MDHTIYHLSFLPEFVAKLLLNVLLILLGWENSFDDTGLHPGIQTESVLDNLFNMFVDVLEESILEALPVADLDQAEDMGPHSLLCQPEVLIDDIFEHLAKEVDLNIVGGIQLDGLD